MTAHSDLQFGRLVDSDEGLSRPVAAGRGLEGKPVTRIPSIGQDGGAARHVLQSRVIESASSISGYGQDTSYRHAMIKHLTHDSSVRLRLKKVPKTLH